MGNTETKPGTKMKVANPPNKNGNGGDWENFGNLFLDPNGRRGTLYLDIPVEQLQKLIKTATDGRVKRKVAIFTSKGKDNAKGGGTQEAAQAAA